jgi:hypothetical protein
MSIFYDPRSKRPHAWTYVFLVIVPVLVFYAIFSYGMRKADEQDARKSEHAVGGAERD